MGAFSAKDHPDATVHQRGHKGGFVLAPLKKSREREKLAEFIDTIPKSRLFYSSAVLRFLTGFAGNIFLSQVCERFLGPVSILRLNSRYSLLIFFDPVRMGLAAVSGLSKIATTE
jgi:hypothetical protein